MTNVGGATNTYEARHELFPRIRGSSAIFKIFIGSRDFHKSAKIILSVG